MLKRISAINAFTDTHATEPRQQRRHRARPNTEADISGSCGYRAVTKMNAVHGILLTIIAAIVIKISNPPELLGNVIIIGMSAACLLAMLSDIKNAGEKT